MTVGDKWVTSLHTSVQVPQAVAVEIDGEAGNLPWNGLQIIDDCADVLEDGAAQRASS